MAPNMGTRAQTRQAFSVVNRGQDLPPNSGPPSNSVFECGVMELTKEDVEALLTEKPRIKNKYNYKEKSEQMLEIIKRLKQCIRWFQQLEVNYVVEQDKLKNLLELADKKCNDLELFMKAKENELNLIIMELRKNLESLQEKFAKEETDKLEALDSLARERDSRLAAQRLQASLSEELKRAQEDNVGANQKIQSLNDMYKRLQEYNTSLQQYNSRLQSELHATNDTLRQVEKYKESTGKYCAQLDTMEESANNLESTCTTQSEEIKRLQEQLALVQKKFQLSDVSAMESRREYEEQNTFILQLQNRLADADLKIVEGEELRKKLHNTILELKGNIRVFCRVRPLLADEATSDGKLISFPITMETQGRGIDLCQNGQKHSFSYDKVFMPDASQEDVFVEISQLVQSALDGYKVCIFAYGQTGSGKTYTMMGTPGIPDHKGLIPRSLEQVFETRQILQSQGWKYEMQVSMLEIYNETIRDLLAPNKSGFDASRLDNAGKQYAIKHDANGNTSVSDLTIVDVRSSREVSYLLERAAQSRSVGKTQMNEQSSRSHFVFTLRITGVNECTDQQVQGVLNLIDLAGSERLSKSGSTGDRLKETQAINKSLSSLSDVIFALAKKDEHVPFRNSKLTYLLQPCLGGDSKTLMFVNVSPDPSSAGESLCSLRFAARVNACEIGIPRRQTNLRTTDSRMSIG